MGCQQTDILLVEDSADDIELTVHVLRREGIAERIEVVRDGEQALDFLFCQGAYTYRNGKEPPRMVLLDLKLPKINGLEVLREIKGDPATKSIPVVVLTASREERDFVSSYGLGVNSYIQKPVDFEQFRQTIKQLGMFWLMVNQPPPTAAFQDA